MTGRLAGRAAIVTGGSRGLGRAIALALAAEGAAVAVAGRTEQVWDDRLPGTIGETVADIEAAGGRAVAVRADLTDRDDIARLGDIGARCAWAPSQFWSTTRRSPRPAAHRCPARNRAPSRQAGQAGRPRKPGWPGFVSTPLAAYRRHFDIAVFAAYELMQMVCPDMIEAGGGSIINVTSVASRMPGDGPYPDRSGGVLPGYGGSKAALEHLTQCAAFDLTDHNIAVNALSPSKPILTPGPFLLCPRIRRHRPGGRIRPSGSGIGAGRSRQGHRTHDRSSAGARRQLPALRAGLNRLGCGNRVDDNRRASCAIAGNETLLAAEGGRRDVWCGLYPGDW